MKNIRELLKNKSGMTLVEAIIATVLLSMVGTLLASVFLVSYKVSSDQVLTKEAAENSASGIEYATSDYTVDFSGSGLTLDTAVLSEVTFNFRGGMTQRYTGSLIKSVDNESGVTYYYFRAN